MNNAQTATHTNIRRHYSTKIKATAKLARDIGREDIAEQLEYQWLTLTDDLPEAARYLAYARGVLMAQFVFDACDEESP